MEPRPRLARPNRGPTKFEEMHSVVQRPRRSNSSNGRLPSLRGGYNCSPIAEGSFDRVQESIRRYRAYDEQIRRNSQLASPSHPENNSSQDEQNSSQPAARDTTHFPQTHDSHLSSHLEGCHDQPRSQETPTPRPNVRQRLQKILNTVNLEPRLRMPALHRSHRSAPPSPPPTTQHP